MKLFSRETHTLLFRTFLIYLIVSLLLSITPARWTGPVRDTLLLPFTLAQRGFLRALQAGERTTRTLTGLRQARQEALRLCKRVRELEVSLLEERERLKAAESKLDQLIRLPAETRTRVVTVAAASYDPSPLRRTVTLKAGSRLGIARNAPVLSNGVLLGRVEWVGPWTCRAILLTDRRCSAAVRCTRSRVQGVLEGIGGGLCAVKYVPPAADVRVGDMFVTSGAEGFFPAGLVVGICTKASTESGEIYMPVEVKPAFDPAQLEDVVILVPEESDQPRKNPDETG